MSARNKDFSNDLGSVEDLGTARMANTFQSRFTRSLDSDDCVLPFPVATVIAFDQLRLGQ